ncbi:ABC transporter substrate-binding protein [Cryptosporangium aurantiacum]|uniref:Hsp70 protein n=1 Tax=Cryptosporangium aurantiacum TaxID=134849 RepID=A0A1M7IE04_9ACTN|nr:ABC transporter substrate-binding protein [Cryptosporangium aurantiacum]SHM38667.1 Hsp70 protein [Cryptosporangium aurantiacum]
MAPAGYALGIDFGTSNTVAVLRHPDGRVESLLFDGSPLLASAVFADPDGQLLTGRDALHSARTRPECLEPNPKRRIDDGKVLLGAHEIPVVDLLTAVLTRVVVEATRVAGRVPDDVVLTHPVSWGPRRLDLLHRAATSAGLGDPVLVPEPVAAAQGFLALPDVRLSAGEIAVVYDLGGGTFDATVVRRTADGFDVLAAEGLADVGGLDIDAAVFGYLGAALATRDGVAWGRLQSPATAGDRRAARLLWDDIRTAKEMLSRSSTADLHVPLFGDELPLGREQLDGLARPLLEHTVDATRAALRAARVTEVAGVFLVGGSSRIPLASTLLFQRLGVAPTVVESPELVVARGALLAAAETSTAGTRTAAGAGDRSTAGAGQRRKPADAATSALRSRRRWWAAAAATVVTLAVVAGVVFANTPGDAEPADAAGTSAPAVAGTTTAAKAAPARSASGSPSASPSASPVCGRKLAVLGPLTGASYARGVPIFNGAKLAVDAYNAEHPGCTVTLARFDSRGLRDVAAERAAEIVADPSIVGLVGPTFSGETLSAAPVFEQAGLPMISPSATSSTLSTRGWQVFHRVLGDDVRQAAPAAKYLAAAGLKRVYLVAENSEYGTVMADAMRAELGSAVIGTGTVRDGQTDFTALAETILAANPQAVYYAGYSDEAGLLRKRLTTAGGSTITLVGGSAMLADTFPRVAGDSGTGTVVTCGCAPVSELPHRFRSAYATTFGADPEHYAAEAYDAANVLLAALAGGRSTRADVLAFLDAYSGQGLTKPLAFDDRGEVEASVVWAYRVEGAKFVPLRRLD